MKFIDSIEIKIRSGNGGPGMVSFRAAKNRPKLGCDGGDGGFGGNVYLLGDRNLNTLSGLFYKQLYAAADGGKGQSNGKTGRNGEDKYISVPLGTMAFTKGSETQMCEVLKEKPYLVAEGGKRGLGNMRFLSSTRQAPEAYTPGGEGIELDLVSELKLIADVGFAGFPNAGKSTLLSRISSARPKVADYPFTTLSPHLGVVKLSDEGKDWGRSFVAADIPGLVEGASDGKGLGHDFLKHLERTKVIAYVIDPFDLTGMKPHEALERLQYEMANYNKKLVEKPSVVVVTKMDQVDDPEEVEEALSTLREQNIHILTISSVSGSGIDKLKYWFYDLIQDANKEIKVEDFSKEKSDEKVEDKFDFFIKASQDSDLGI